MLLNTKNTSMDILYVGNFDDIYEIYGLPSEQIAIDRDTTCIVVDYYLSKFK